MEIFVNFVLLKLVQLCLQDQSKIEISLFVLILFFKRYEYLWADGETVKQPIKVSAPEYVDYLMVWIVGIIEDEEIFPSRVGNMMEFFKFLEIHIFQNTRSTLST